MAASRDSAVCRHVIISGDLEEDHVFQSLPSARIFKRVYDLPYRRQVGLVLSGQKDHVLDISGIATDEFRSNQVLNRGTVYFEASEAFDEYWLERTNLRWPCLNQLHLWLVWIECCLGIE